MSKENQILDTLYEIRRQIDKIEAAQAQTGVVLGCLVQAVQLALANQGQSPAVQDHAFAKVDEVLKTDAQPAVADVVYKDIAEVKHFTPKQHVVAQLVMRGWPNKMIGEVMNVSANTVKQHIRAVMKRFDVKTRGALGTRFGNCLAHMTDSEYERCSSGLPRDWYHVAEQNEAEVIEDVDPFFRLYRSSKTLN